MEANSVDKEQVAYVIYIYAKSMHVSLTCTFNNTPNYLSGRLQREDQV